MKSVISSYLASKQMWDSSRVNNGYGNANQPKKPPKDPNAMDISAFDKKGK